VTKDGTIGKVAHIHEVPGRATLNSGVFRISSGPLIDSRFLYWVFESDLFADFVGLLGQGSTIDHLYQRDLTSFGVPVPALEVQVAIARRLDGETSRIDAVIDSKMRLTELLRERAAACVHGLLETEFGPAAPRRDLPWLRKVPDAWPTVSIGLLADVFAGSTPTAERLDRGIPWSTSGELDQHVIRVPTAYFDDATVAGSGLRLAPAGSVVVGLVGQGRTRGLTAILGIDSTLNQNIAAVVSRGNDLLAEYLGLMLQTAYEDLRNGGRGGNQEALNSELLRAYRVPVPPPAEQRRLVSLARAQRSRDQLLERAVRASVALLRERRRSLITAMVTEQLPVEAAA
jgi:type I restriction enzyme S subunit